MVVERSLLYIYIPALQDFDYLKKASSLVAENGCGEKLAIYIYTCTAGFWLPEKGFFIGSREWLWRARVEL